MVACVPSGEQPPAERVYFPVGIAVSRSADHLLVINSDFDLQFAQGTIQSLDLARVRELTRRPCKADTECGSEEKCDLEPSAENGDRPGYVCVDREDPRPCGVLGDKSAFHRAVAPGRCAPIELDAPGDGGPPLLTDVAEFSAFATQGVLFSRPCGSSDAPRVCEDSATPADRIPDRDGSSHPERLFIPVRGDTSIHYVDVTDSGHLVCGRKVETQGVASFEEAAGGALRCRDHRVALGTTFGLNEQGELLETREPPIPGDDIEEDRDDDDPFFEFRVQPEPLDLAGTPSGRVIVVTHQVRGVVSTLMNNWVDTPRLIHVLRDLPSRPIGVSAVGAGPLADGSFRDESEYDFLVTYRSDAQVDLLHFQDDGLLTASSTAAVGSSGPLATVFRPSLVRAASTNILVNSPGDHSRGLLVTSSDRDRAASACASGDGECVAAADEVPLDVYIANRTPNSMLLARTGGSDRLAPSDSLPRIYDTLPLTAGPTRIVSGPIVRPDGSTATRVFVICFDDGIIYIYDPEHRRIESEIRTGRGPYAMAFDPVRPVAYVAHFTDSHIGVISLDQSHPKTFGATLATLGMPEEPPATGDN